jgi:hypothetical protein
VVKRRLRATVDTPTVLLGLSNLAQCTPERRRRRHSSWVGVFEVNLGSNVLPVLSSRIHPGFCDETLGGLYASRLVGRL